MNIAIVVVAYDRSLALKRLLRSIEGASYDEFDDIPLIISIDGGGDPEVASVAQQFKWRFGEKKVYTHKTNLGLKAHVLNAGDIAADYDGIIMIEDDLMVSPLFYRYGSRALAAYQNNQEIAGISLYSYRYLDINGLVFFPSVGNADTFLIKFPSSCGQAWTTRQWQVFRRWLSSGRDDNSADLNLHLPKKASSWPATSWKKSFARYLIDENKYIVYPAFSLTTNMGNAGYHWRYSTLIFQVPLQFAARETQFADPAQAISYDQFFELEARSLSVMGYSGDLPSGIEFDLYGEKPLFLIKDKLVVSSKTIKTPQRSFGMQLLPHELNVLCEIPGQAFSLGEGSQFIHGSRMPRTKLLRHQTAYLGGRDLARLLVDKLLGRIGVNV